MRFASSMEHHLSYRDLAAGTSALEVHTKCCKMLTVYLSQRVQGMHNLYKALQLSLHQHVLLVEQDIVSTPVRQQINKSIRLSQIAIPTQLKDWP